MTAKTVNPPQSMRSRIAELCDGERGATASEVAAVVNLPAVTVSAHMTQLKAAGRLSSARIMGFRGLAHRWFTSQAAAEAFHAMAQPKPRSVVVLRGGVDAPVTIYADTRIPVGDAAVPRHVLPAYGVASGHDPRYQVGPGDEVPSIFRSVPLGMAHMLPGVR